MSKYFVVMPRKAENLVIGFSVSRRISLHLYFKPLVFQQTSRKVPCEDCVWFCRSVDSCSILCVGRTFEACAYTELLHWWNTWSKSGSKAPNSFFLFAREFTDVLNIWHLLVSMLDSWYKLYAVKIAALKGIF